MSGVVKNDLDLFRFADSWEIGEKRNRDRVRDRINLNDVDSWGSAFGRTRGQWGRRERRERTLSLNLPLVHSLLRCGSDAMRPIKRSESWRREIQKTD